MSLSVERYDDVTRLRMANLGSRAFRLDVSAYVVRGVMIDSGFPHVCEQLLRAVDSIGINGCIVTHSHEDHAGNAAPLAHRGVSLLATEETVRVLRARPAIALYRRIAWVVRPLSRTSSSRSISPDCNACARRDTPWIIRSYGTRRHGRSSRVICGLAPAFASCMRPRSRIKSSRACGESLRSTRRACSMRTAVWSSQRRTRSSGASTGSDNRSPRSNAASTTDWMTPRSRSVCSAAISGFVSRPKESTRRATSCAPCDETGERPRGFSSRPDRYSLDAFANSVRRSFIISARRS